MRVLFLTHRLPFPLNRGDRIRAFHLIETLARDADIDLISLVHDRAEQQASGELHGLVSSVRTALVARMTNHFRAALALAGPVPLTHVLLHSPDVERLIVENLNHTAPDVVLVYGSGMARYAREDLLLRLPFVLDMVDVDSVKWELMSRTTAWPM